jgi:hypothetical protein
MSHDIVNEAFTLVLRLWAQDRKGRKERRRAGR